MSQKPVIFISCGQSTEEERKLGAKICEMIREIRPEFEPYFAEAQTTVEALSNNVLGALHKAAGIVCIMHERGEVKSPTGTTIRGSVWVEQELAIAAYMQHVLKRDVPVLFYKRPSVALEGIRSVLLANPTLCFSSSEDILDDLRSRLPLIEFTSYAEYDLVPEAAYREKSITSSRHDYSLTVDLKNTGKMPIYDFKLRCFFPREFIDGNPTFACEEECCSNSEYVCLTITDADRSPKPLYPGDRLHNPLIFDYYIDDKLFRNHGAMGKSVRICLWSGSMDSKEVTVPIIELHRS